MEIRKRRTITGENQALPRKTVEDVQNRRRCGDADRHLRLVTGEALARPEDAMLEDLPDHRSIAIGVDHRHALGDPGLGGRIP